MSMLKITTIDQTMFYYIIMLEIMAVVYEYHN